MSDITGQVNALLKSKQVPLITRHRYSIDQLDEFLKEAYRIHARIADLTSYLRANRAAYLSTTPASRLNRKDEPRIAGTSNGHASSPTRRPLTDRERADIDTHSKALLRQLNGAITSLFDAERVRQDTASLVTSRKRAGGGLGGALGRWAAGGAPGNTPPRTEAEASADAQARMLTAHREGVIWLLRTKLEETGKVQALMMETRLAREEEKAKSVLYKARRSSGAGIDASLLPGTKKKSQHRPNGSAAPPDTTSFPDGDANAIPEGAQLSDEQLQLFAEENQGMLRHLGAQLDQVRAVHRSLEEISQLQTSLVANLETQGAHIDQLVADSFATEDNVGRGNKELKRASERTSTARLLFHGTCAFCTFLVVWDLIF